MSIFVSVMAGIYIHIPFCKCRCLYCDFYSNTDMSLRSDYLDALLGELSLRFSELRGEPVETLYIGGGTPSQLSVSELQFLFDGVARYFDIDACREVTLEANPDDLSPEYIFALRELPVNRISMGVQSFDDQELKFLNRRHSAKQAVEAVGNCRKAGLENISIDLIYGLPGQIAGRWENHLDRAISLGVPHISAYNLIYEEGTSLFRMREKGLLQECDEDTCIRLFESLMDKLALAGYEHYEISNFCLPGKEAVHNTSYWKQVPYLGLGASAHSYDGDFRRFNKDDIHYYIDRIKEGKVAYEEESKDLYSRYNEMVLTSLRTRWGMNTGKLERLYGKELHDYCLQQAYPHIRSGKMSYECGILRITRSGLFVSDDIMSDLFYV